MGDTNGISSRDICIGLSTLAVGLYLTLIIPIVVSIMTDLPSNIQNAINIISNLLDPLFSVLISLFVVAGGALLSWRVQRRLTAPKLQLDESGISRWRPHSVSDKIIFRVPVKNVGARSAENCKAEINMEFESENSNWQIKQSVSWSETGFPSSIEINPEEISYINLLILHRQNNQISVSSGNSIESETAMTRPREDGVILRESTIEKSSAPKIYTKVRSTRITTANQKNFKIKVSSRNSETISIPFDIVENDPIEILVDDDSFNND